MNQVDFSFPGGFPLDQEVLDFMQISVKDTFKGILSEAGATPVILSGMVDSGSDISDGFFYYAGEIYRFNGAHYSIPPSLPDVKLAALVDHSFSSVQFEDFNYHEIYRERYGGYDTGSPDSIHLELSTFRTWHDTFGLRANTAPFTSVAISVSGGFATGTLLYKKNYLTNTLHLKGTISVVSTGSLPNDPPLYYSAITGLPAECTPVTTVPFKAFYRYHSSAIIEKNGLDYIMDLNAEVGNSGTISIGFLRTSSPTTYSVSFNTIIPLS